MLLYRLNFFLPFLDDHHDHDHDHDEGRKEKKESWLVVVVVGLACRLVGWLVLILLELSGVEINYNFFKRMKVQV